MSNDNAKTVNTNKTKTLFVDTVLFGISNFGSKILLFLLTPLYTAVLATEEFGVADLINTTINLIYPVLTLSICEATLRFAMEKGTSQKLVMNNSLLLIIISVVVLMFCYPLVGLFDESIVQYWTIFVITYILTNLYICLTHFIKAIGKTKLFAVLGILHTLVLIVSNFLFLVVFKIGLYGYLVSIILSFLLPIIFAFVFGGIYNYISFEFDKDLLKRMLKYSIPMIPTLLAWAINTSIGKYIIIGFQGLGESGIYSAAQKIPTLLTTIINVFLQAWQLSAISNCNSDDEGEYYTKIYNGLNVICLVSCIAIVPLSKVFSSILFAKAYFSAWKYIPLLTIAVLFSSLNGFLAAAFRAYMKTQNLFISVVIGAAVNVIASLILTPYIGGIGVAAGMVAGFLATWIIRIVMVQKLVHIKFNAIKTIVAYALLIITSLIITFDVPFAYIIFAVSALVVLLVNGETVKLIVDFCFKYVAKILKKAKRT